MAGVSTATRDQQQCISPLTLQAQQGEYTTAEIWRYQPQGNRQFSVEEMEAGGSRGHSTPHGEVLYHNSRAQSLCE